MGNLYDDLEEAFNTLLGFALFGFICAVAGILCAVGYLAYLAVRAVA